jgi:hypothetical protein
LREIGTTNARLGRSVTHGERIADAVFTWESTNGFKFSTTVPLARPAG